MKQAIYEGLQITALGHAGFLVSSDEPKVKFAFDPYDLPFGEPVDFIFISHPHFDHCDAASIRKLMGPKTKIVTPEVCSKELEEFTSQVELVADKDKHQIGPLTYWTIPAYNVDKFRTPNEVFHPKDSGGVGFVVEVEGIRFYHAGDTDNIPEMEQLKKIDVAFLPISGTYVMTLEEAMKAAEMIKPKMVVPMHFGKLLGSVTDAHRFQTLLNDKVPVTVLTTSAD